jgi:hypothetical protein
MAASAFRALLERTQEKRGLTMARAVVHALPLRIFSVLAIITAFSSVQLSAQIHLHIQNVDSQPVTVELLNDNFNCYEGPVSLGQIWENLATGASVTMDLYRVHGHGCDGRQGEFELKFTPGAGIYTTQHFDFDNDGHLELSSGHPNQYPGQLRMNASADYTYSTYKRPAVTAGHAIGRWDELCEQICNYSIQDAVSTSNTKTNTYSEEEKHAIEASLETGVEVEGVGSAKSTISATWEKDSGKSMSEAFARGETWTDTRTYSYTPEQMAQFHVFAVWQWIAETHLSNGTVATVRSPHITCTPDAVPPAYVPGSPEELTACGLHK